MKTLENFTSIENQLSSSANIEQTLWPLIEPTSIVIKLNCNESPFDIPQELKQEITNKMVELDWNRYPDLQQTELTTILANSVNLKSENILLGNGSSQLIQQIVNAVSKFVSEAVIESPTFMLYHQICQNERLSFREWQLNNNGAFDLKSFPTISEPALVIITSPNNPTGATLSKTDLKNLLNLHPNCIFVVDEAYGEFANESAIGLVSEYANLLVLRTFSKGFGLPSARFGYMAGNKQLVDLIRKHTIPFTINIFTELLVRESLTNPVLMKIIKTNQERIKNLRDFTHFLLSKIADETRFSVLQSASNFLLLRFHQSELLEQIKQVLVARNILVSYPLPNCLRLTIGTEVEMSKIVRVIKQNVEVFQTKPIEALSKIV